MLSEVSSTPMPLTHPHSERGVEGEGKQGIHTKENGGVLERENETGRDWIMY